MNINSNHLDQNLKCLNAGINSSRLVGLEARVWQKLEADHRHEFLVRSGLLWRGATLSLVLIIGGIVGATTVPAKASASLEPFSSAPAYSVMRLVEN